VSVEKMFWNNKKVLITGYEGFLGSSLTKRLLDTGAKVTGLDILTHRAQTVLTRSDLRKIKVVKGSVETFKLTKEILHRDKIEVIFHLAAQPIVNISLKKPTRTFSANIKGTWNVLEAARRCDYVKTVVVASSDKAYGVHSVLPYKEDAPLAGCYPYDVSKSCADLLANTYAHAYQLPVCITRCGNIFGPGDFHFSRIVPDTVKSALEDETLIIRSSGKFTRDYIYIEDVVDGYILLAEKMQKLNLFGQAFNFSYENPISVLELVKRIYRLAKRTPKYEIANFAKCEIEHQYLCSAKAKKLLVWKPKHSLSQGLKNTIEWYKGYFDSDE